MARANRSSTSIRLSLLQQRYIVFDILLLEENIIRIRDTLEMFHLVQHVRMQDRNQPEKDDVLYGESDRPELDMTEREPLRNAITGLDYGTGI